MATRKRVSRRDATLKSEDQGVLPIDEEMQDDALERAEALLKQKKLKQSPTKKIVQRPKSESERSERDSDDSGEDDDYDSEEMNDFIANDDEVEAELIKHHQLKKEKRKKRREQSGAEKKASIKQLDDEDLEMIRENAGIEIKKKNRLKRNAEIEAERSGVVKDQVQQPKQQQSVKEEFAAPTQRRVKRDLEQDQEMQIDTTQAAPHKQERRYADERPVVTSIDPERLRKAQNIFGDEDDEPMVKADATRVQGSQQTLKEIFNTDEIDDPFSSEFDNKIAQTDIPERIQVRIEAARRNPTEDELRKEAEWILERLTTLPGGKYGILLQLPEVREKIYMVLTAIRNKQFDVPMIVKYRKYEYADELDEEAVWHIWTMDQEYGKFQRQKKQIEDFLIRIQSFDPQMKSYLDELAYAKSMSELANFSALIRFLRSYFHDQLMADESHSKRKQPQRRDEIQLARTNNLQNFASLCFLSWAQFQENLQLKKLASEPPEPKQHPGAFASEFQCDQYPDELAVFKGVCSYAAQELAAQPFIRNIVKKAFRDNGYLSTNPTEQGKKDLDLFHPNYRVKHVNKRPIKDLMNSDLYLDIMQCEKSGLVQVNIAIDPHKAEDLKVFMEELYMQERGVKEQWNIMRAEVIRLLLEDTLEQEVIKEMREELREQAELYVIAKCKKVYKELLMTGPFQTSTEIQQPRIDEGPKKKGQKEADIIKDRERLCVLGATMHQINANNYIVTVAVVDKFGNLVSHKDFMRLLPPRQRKSAPGAVEAQNAGGEARPQPHTEEQKEHENDKAKLIEILEQNSVDLIVVAANSLEARNLKRVLEDVAFELKTKQPAVDQDARRSKPLDQQPGKEAFVIWGSTEVAKLFAMSHNSQKLHKGVQQILKQTISLARFQQEPLAEVLNLWSPITAENQALQLQLDPMQRLVNQVRLADGLEEVNVQVVNDVGIDLNLLVQHEHLHCMLQFLSGLGPRMAKRLISKTKQLGKKLATRGEILKHQLILNSVYMSAVPFIKIKVPSEDFAHSNHVHKFDILDQTRIHHESYKLAMKIATDACAESEGKEVDKAEQNRFCKDVIANPERLKNLDLKQYFQQLEMTNMGNMRTIIEQIIQEFKSPFNDPREARMPTKQAISNERLFYLLIDESPLTFKKGLIVTATVSKVLETKAICRLENGLSALIPATAFSEDALAFGHIVTGRVEKISTEDEKRFEVTLHCKQRDLSSHDKYVDDLCASLGIAVSSVPREDLINHNFMTDVKPKQLGRFVPRRIAHEKFKNISSKRALAELDNSDVGDFVFRPSTRSEDYITLTWKFWKKHFVHIDIAEHDKQPGSAMGSRLVISSDYFENLKEIVERYIIPCNRLVRDVTTFSKWSDFERWEDLEESLREEKTADKGRIPYRLAILPQYPQHVVLAYVPREKVIKEFIKIRPRGYYFHDQNHTPFVQLINWFKEMWTTKDYQRHLKRQKSPRTQARAATAVHPTPSAEQRRDDYGQNASGWQAQGGGSVHSHGGDIKNEQRSYGRGQRSARKSSPGGWGMKNEGAKSPGGDWGNQGAGWGKQEDAPMQDFSRANDRSGTDRPRSNACFNCKEEGHMSRDCPKPDQRQGGGQRGRGCHNCGEEGHFARECPKNEGGSRRPRNDECYRCHEVGHIGRDCPNDNGGERGYKRQRKDDGGSYRRETEGGDQGWGASGHDNNQSNNGGASGWEAQQQKSDGGWGQQAKGNGWDDKSQADPSQENGGWGNAGGMSQSQSQSGW